MGKQISFVMVKGMTSKDSVAKTKKTEETLYNVCLNRLQACASLVCWKFGNS